MPRLLSVSNKLVQVSTTAIGVARWGDLVAWTHSWDAEDATTYADDGTDWSISAATRVDSVIDRGSGSMPLTRDDGSFSTLFSHTDPYPGPLWIASSNRFGGRPAWRTDLIVDNGGTFDQYSLLSPQVDPEDSAYWFNDGAGYSTPYWVSVFGRLPSVPGGLLDAQQGDVGTTVTIGSDSNPASPHRWALTTGLSHAWPATAIDQSVDETVLATACVNGASSFLELMRRDTSGGIVVTRTTLTLDNENALELFFGFVHGAYVTAAGLKTGAPSDIDIQTVRQWAARYMPISATLAAEP